MIFQCMA